MREKINQDVSVVMYYSASKRLALPHLIHWQNQDYGVGKIGYHHTIKEGMTLHHIFELVDSTQTLWFRLNLDTSNLHWKLEAVSDGLPY
jgi:hypothetical protein